MTQLGDYSASKEQYIADKLLEMCEDNASATEIYNFTSEFFTDTHGKYLRAFEKRIFDVHIKPLRKLCLHDAVKQNLVKLYACGIKRYIDEDFDYIIGIAGLEGRGKSACSLALANYLVELGMNFDMNQNMFFRGDATKEGFLKACEKVSGSSKSVIIFDEGKAFFDKRQSMNFTRIEVLQEITSQRSKNNVIIINVGDSSEVDLYFRERRFRTIMQIPDRYLFVALMNRGVIGMGEDRFAMKYFEWQLSQMKHIDYLAQLNALYNLPTQYGIGRIPLIPQHEYAKYKKIKDARNSVVPELIRLKHQQQKSLPHNTVRPIHTYIENRSAIEDDIF